MARSIPPPPASRHVSHAGFERRFETLRHGYSRLLKGTGQPSPHHSVMMVLVLVLAR